MSWRVFGAVGALCVAASPVLGCGGTVSTGTGGGGSFTSTGSSGVPATADGAWVVNLDPGTSGTCNFGIAHEALGDVTPSSIVTKVVDGQAAPNESGLVASVHCSVTGSGSFAVSATAVDDAKSLEVTIASITPGATKASPGLGSVTFSSAQVTAGAVFSSASNGCDVYFLPQGLESVASGKIWGAFTCSALMDPSTGASCALAESFFVFEDCASQ